MLTNEGKYIRQENNNQHTKIKIIEPEDIDFTTDDYTIVANGRKHILVNREKPNVSIKPIIMCKGCTVKYTPEKYNKISIQLNQYDAEMFIDFANKIEAVVPCETFLKDDAINLKLTSEQKEEYKEVKRGAFCDVVFKFNEIWNVGGKNYASFELLDLNLRTSKKYF